MKKEGSFSNNKKRQKSSLKFLALTQISILMLEIFSFTFFLSLIFVANINTINAANIPNNNLVNSNGDVNPPGQTTPGIDSNLVVGAGAAAMPAAASTLGTDTAADVAAQAAAHEATHEALGAAITTPAPQTGEFTILGKTLFTSTSQNWGQVLTGLQYATYVFAIGQLLGMMIPGKKDMINAATYGIMAGIIASKVAVGVMKEANWLTTPGTDSMWTQANVGIGVGIVVAYFVFAYMNKQTKTKQKTIEFKCMNWQAPLGGSDCDKCNGNPQQPCSEYRCKSLGQTCALINAGTGQDRCIDSSPNDVTSPGIKPWPSALSLGYKYTDVQERPPGNANVPGHMKITDPSTKDGCLKAFTPFEFGIVTTDVGGVTQPAQCKIDFNHTASMKDMAYWMADNNLFIENHSQVMSLPGTDLLKTLYSDANGTLPVKNDGEYTFYLRCMDGNGNENRDEFAVRFCIDKGEDISAPLIKATSIPTGSPVVYNADNVSLDVYTNEPANCKWSRKDTEYNNMENQMTCSNKLWEMNSEFYYTCKTTLTGIKDKVDNDFFFRCEDTSTRKNQMQQSYAFKLIGTQPLTILSTAPNGTIGSATSTATVNLEVKTDNGYKNGEATCFYSPNSNSGFITMFETGTNVHKQSLDLLQGDYTYYFKCVDLGGNIVYNSTTFSTFVDTFAPSIIRAYNLEDKLIIVTDEDSQCKYSTTSCNFDSSKEGIILPDTSTDKKTHYADWKLDQTYYIKCSDSFGNQPDPTSCSMVLRPSSLVVNTQ